MKKGFWPKAAMGAAALAMVVGLAGCGQKSNNASSSSSSVKTEMSASAKAYSRANDLIEDGQYGQALDRLSDVENPNKNVTNLSTDLENYIAARRAYRMHNYQTAATKLSAMKSESAPMRRAYKSLRMKITKAMDNNQNQSSSQQTTNSSSQQQANNNASNTTAANAKAASQTGESVIASFAEKAGYNKQGYGIIPVSKNGNVYRFEVRQSNGDNTVANMVGIFDYNESTGAITRVN